MARLALSKFEKTVFAGVFVVVANAHIATKLGSRHMTHPTPSLHPRERNRVMNSMIIPAGNKQLEGEID